MKRKKDTVHPEVKATLGLASSIARVEPSPNLKNRILERLADASPKVIPLYRRAGVAVAAAVLILAVNLVTVVYYVKQESAAASTTAESSDRLAEIQAAYSLDESVY